MIDQQKVELKITGRVQGVWYRGFTKKKADSLGLSGWVKNDNDGSVSACVIGPQDVIDIFLKKLNEGPPFSRVDNISIDYKGAGEPTGIFEVIR